MGWVMIAVIAILVIFTLMGRIRGFISMVVGLASLIISIVGAAMLTQPVGTFLDEKTGLHDTIQNQVVSTVESSIEQAKEAAMKSAGIVDVSKLKKEDFMAELNKLPLPDEVKETIEQASGTDVAAVGRDVAVKAGDTMAGIVINALAFVICFVVLIVVTSVLRVALKITSHLPLLKQMNGLLGTVLGFVEAVVVIWIFFAVATSAMQYDWARDVIAQIIDNRFLTMLYNLNPIIKYL